MKSFELKKEHILLLSKMYVSWDECEFGAPSIDPKRPYGNSWVLGDMADILGISYDDDSDNPFTEEQESYLYELHYELETALQIVLNTLSFVPGTYYVEDYSIEWKLK
ncbi:MAG: hypothetical protein WC679_02065 [Bacteroidales bacterium]|jgi:hypothetical protein